MAVAHCTYSTGYISTVCRLPSAILRSLMLAASIFDTTEQNRISNYYLHVYYCQLLPWISALPSPPLLATQFSARQVAAAAVGLKLVSTLNTMLSNYYVGNPVLSWSGPHKEWRDWSKEIILITGASSGMGRAMAIEFARRGITVVAVDRNEPVSTESDAFPTNHVHFYRLDVTDSDAVHALVQTLRSDVGDPTVVINNAGVFNGQTLLDATPAQIQLTFAVNAVAPLLVTRAFLPAMLKAKHGHIVSMASMASFVSIASNIDYSCTKAGLLGFYEGLSQELQWRYHCPAIRNSIVHPFWVETPLLTDDMASRTRFDDKIMTAEHVAHKIVAHVLSGRSGQLLMPESMFMAGYLRALPIWIQESLRNGKGLTLMKG
ncbi:short-chain dehydrogenase reductase [Ophiostoma piceae UAMH 11346]|uniref:Short-chain dehydrogenase/reductase 3 n=1 Tax=Ophiostoma piceae (strain UAMH 11346) TaxID=1262450 RepID=S3D3W8_OPHP1|nr:short-chain dehydrogenase reductase [Ophiostoma piceae UAMH 11346]